MVLIANFFLWYSRRICLFKVNNRNTRKSGEIFSKLTIKTPEWRQWRRSALFIFNFEHISHFFLVSRLLTLKKYMFARQVFSRPGISSFVLNETKVKIWMKLLFFVVVVVVVVVGRVNFNEWSFYLQFYPPGHRTYFLRSDVHSIYVLCPKGYKINRTLLT